MIGKLNTTKKKPKSVKVISKLQQNIFSYHHIFSTGNSASTFLISINTDSVEFDKFARAVDNFPSTS